MKPAGVNTMSQNVPLLNDYKREFFWKRFPQTILGGPKLRIGYSAPAYVYIYQILFFLFPWILGGVFTVLVELQLLEELIAVYAYGSSMFVYVVLVNTVSAVLQTKRSAISQLAKNHTFSEDDEVEFTSVCGVETIEFVIPGKKYKVNIVLHAFLSSALCGLGFWYFLPTTLNRLYGDNLGVTVVLFIAGWLTLLIAQYSLTVAPPPETAMFRATDLLESTHLMRPLYTLIILSFDLLDRFLPGFTGVNQVLHIMIIFLPLLWTAGCLPPLDALFLWLFEQVLIFLFGGSPMAGDIRLLVMLLWSVGVFIVIYFVPRGLQTVALMAVCGYILSIDLGGLVCMIRQKLRQPTLHRPNTAFGFLWSWSCREIAFHIIMVICLGVVSSIVNYVSLADDIGNYLKFGIIGIFLVDVILSEIQGASVFFGLWRNKLYPSSVEQTKVFNARKKRLNAVGYVRRAIVNFVAPYVMLVVLSWLVQFSVVTSDMLTDVLSCIGALRAFRWIWQSTKNALFEFTVVTIVQLALPNLIAWHDLDIGLQLLIISFCRDRLGQILSKLVFWLSLLISSWTDKKQRRSSSIALVILNIVLLPLVLIVILVSAVLSAPLLPLFTLPVLLIGYPRPVRTWPGAVGATATIGPDTVYYTQLTPELVRSLRMSIANGSLGEPNPGRHYLVRYQDRLVWLMILERGYGYTTISVKGLELQETSCHTLEATRIDDTLDVTFEIGKALSCCTCSSYPLSVLRPCDAVLVKSYSDARNQLTGVLDSPDVLRKIASGFIKCLIWVLLHHVSTSAKSNGKVDSCQLDSNSVLDPNKKKNDSNAIWRDIEEHNYTYHDSTSVAQDVQTKKKSRLANSHFESELHSPRRSNAKSPSERSCSDSVWSSGADSIFGDSTDSMVQKNKKLDYVNDFPESPHLNNFETIMEKPAVKTKTKPLVTPPGVLTVSTKPVTTGMCEDLDFGLPAVDVNIRSTSLTCGAGKTKQDRTRAIILANFAEFQSTHSSKYSLPAKWLQIPMEGYQLSKLQKDFPQDWYRHTIEVASSKAGLWSGDRHVLETVTTDDVLMKTHSLFTMACYAVLYELGQGGCDVVTLGPSHVFKVYNGAIPWSLWSEWITEDSELLELVLKAYRFAVKLAIDETLLGEADSIEEVQDYLEEYEKDWYIGSEMELQWNQAVLANKPHLFSLTQDLAQATYHSRILSLCETAAYISSLNTEAVRAQWANLSLELLYMTNDDEERYSIQAHPAMLRNLTVQAADPPLGYPVYSSQPISLPTL